MPRSKCNFSTQRLSREEISNSSGPRLFSPPNCPRVDEATTNHYLHERYPRTQSTRHQVGMLWCRKRRVSLQLHASPIKTKWRHAFLLPTPLLTSTAAAVVQDLPFLCILIDMIVSRARTREALLFPVRNTDDGIFHLSVPLNATDDSLYQVPGTRYLDTL